MTRIIEIIRCPICNEIKKPEFFENIITGASFNRDFEGKYWMSNHVADICKDCVDLLE